MSYVCDICERQFNYITLLELHYVSHTSETSFPCEFCVKSFSYETHLIVHRFEEHGERGMSKTRKKLLPDENCLDRHCVTSTQEPLQTCISNKGISQNFTSNTPAQSHAYKKPYSCSKCDETFLLKKNLKVHYRVHTKVRPFVCYTCGKKYRRKHSLKDHFTEIHMKETSYI